MHHARGNMACDALGANLRAAREQRGLLITEVADRFQVTRQTVHRWETGAFEPSIAILVGLAELYGTTVERLIRGDEAA